MPLWVFRLGHGRLWFHRPRCIGFYAGLMLIENNKEHWGRRGTEVILTRREI